MAVQAELVEMRCFSQGGGVAIFSFARDLLSSEQSVHLGRDPWPRILLELIGFNRGGPSKVG